MKLIPISEAARLLGVTPNTLRKWEDPSGEFVTVYGHRIRVYRIGPSRRSQRRYNETEIYRVLARMAKEKAPQEGGPERAEG